MEKSILERSSLLKKRKVLAGFDGFIDYISCAVKKRYGRGENFDRIKTVKEFADRISSASQKSTNIELYTREEKFGGNGPIFSNSLLELGAQVKYIGLLGDPILPQFEKFAKRSNAVTLGKPGKTNAVEFEDGKILFGNTAPLDSVNYGAIVEKVGAGKWLELLAHSYLISFQNWTMVNGMTEILAELIHNVIPSIGQLEANYWFFDLADPEKRTAVELNEFLQLLKKFQAHGCVVLSLNLKEFEQVCFNVGVEYVVEEGGMSNVVERLRRELGIGILTVHNAVISYAASRNDYAHINSQKLKEKRCLTGSGDHFNAGFALGLLTDSKLKECLHLGNSCAAKYIETGKSPSLTQIIE